MHVDTFLLFRVVHIVDNFVENLYDLSIKEDPSYCNGFNRSVYEPGIGFVGAGRGDCIHHVHSFDDLSKGRIVPIQI